MKKVMLLGMVLALFTVAASAQQNRNDFRSDRQMHQRFEHKQLTRGEKAKLNKNDRQFHRTKKWYMRDGKISHGEKRKLSKMKRKDRHETYRFRHNRRHRA